MAKEKEENSIHFIPIFHVQLYFSIKPGARGKLNQIIKTYQLPALQP